MKTIKVLVENEVWETFYRFFPGQGERTRLLRNFIFRKIREESKKRHDKKYKGRDSNGI